MATEHPRDDSSQDGTIDGVLKALSSVSRAFTHSKQGTQSSPLDAALEPDTYLTHREDNYQDSFTNIACGTLVSESHTRDDSKDTNIDRMLETSPSFRHAREVRSVRALDGPPPHQQGEWLSIHNEEDALETVKMIQLTPTDHSYICQAIGATSLDETHTLLHTKSFWWPPKGLPDGLYKDVISARFLSQCRYHACSVFFNFSLVAQYECFWSTILTFS